METKGNEDGEEGTYRPDVREGSGGSIRDEVDPVESRSANAGHDRSDQQPGADSIDPDHEGVDGRVDDPRTHGHDLEKIEPEVLAELVEEAVGRAVEVATREAVSVIGESFSGPVPQAKDLLEYTPEQQERILRMAEAPRTDESARRDRVVDAGIASNKRSAFIQPTLFVLCLALSAVSFWVFNNAFAGSVFLGYPVLNFLAGVRWNWRRGGSATKPEDEV